MSKPSISKPWLKHYDEDNINRPLPKCSMYRQLVQSCANCPDQTALDYYGTRVTYRELADKIDQYAAAFREFGIKEGEYVSFYTVSIPESIYALYGLNKIGAVCNLIDMRTDANHTEEFIGKAKSDVLIVLDLFYEKLAESIDRLGMKKVIVQSSSDSLPFVKRLLMNLKSRVSIPSDSRIIKNKDLEALGKGKSVDEIPYEKDRPAVVVRTGGTTGVSKGVILTNDNLNAVYANFRDVIGSGEGSSILNFLPFAVSYGVACGVHMGLCMNGIDILIPRFKPDDFADLIYKYKPNYIIGVPIFYENLMHSEKMKNFDLSFIKAMAAGGDSANIAFEQRLRKFTAEHGVSFPLSQGYGMSEVSSAAAFGVFNIHKDGSAGIPCVHTVISVFDPDTQEELETGQSGEICITGPTVMKEYLDEPEETAHVMRTHSDGSRWIHSGDIGYIDEDGFLFIKGRIKRTVVRFDGHKSYPVQIEGVVDKHPAVKNCCVVPIKDMTHDQGELPLVVVEPALEVYDGNEEKLRRELFELCADGIEERSQPVGVVVVDRIPLTGNGKKDAKKLTDMYWDYDYLSERK